MTIGSHQQTVGKTQEHLTPKWIIDRLGPFDLDPCAAKNRPWDCATDNYTEGGLDHVWAGRIWLNPPFDRYQVGAWMTKLANHGNGIALLHARTETEWFRPAWERASILHFMFDRVKFWKIDGTPQPANSGAPVVLVGFGRWAEMQIRSSGIHGALVQPGDIIPAMDVAA